MPRAEAWPRAAAAVRAALALALALALQGCIKPPKKCSKAGFNCMETGCCMEAGQSCYARDNTWGECAVSCTPSFSRTCKLIGHPATAAPAAGGQAVQDSSSSSSSGGGSSSSSGSSYGSSPAPPPAPVAIDWQKGTWTSAYWDCCKPSCAAEGKGDVDYQIGACHAETGKKVDGDSGDSVCDGGSVGMCADYRPFKVNSNLSYGFAALAASGKHGLEGDRNCGQCYELLFTGERHTEDGPKDPWGGAHPELEGRRIVVQVATVNFETMANHSFDILIPGAGQGAYESGCMLQYPDYATDDFDCGSRTAGCMHNSSCADMPKDLQAGCSWRFEWYRWLAEGGQTNAPFVKFRRVQCPDELTKISGATPTDDYDFPMIDTSESFTS